MPGQFAAGADQGAHLRAALHDVSLVQVVGLRTEHGVEVRHHGGRGGGKLIGLFDEDHGVVGAQPGVGEFDGQMAGGNAVAFLERSGFVDALAVQHGAVFAAQVLHLPGVAMAGQGEVLARQAGVVGIAQLVGPRPAERDAVAIERHHYVLAVDVADYQFAGRHLRQEVSVASDDRSLRSRLSYVSRYTLMKHMKTALFVAISVITVAFLWFWWKSAKGQRAETPGSPGIVDILIGFVTNFFDMLGIGSFAPTT